MLQYFDSEKSYIAATIKYINEVLNIDVDEFKVSELPDEWLQCIEKEANEKKLLKKDLGKNSFFLLFSKEGE